MPGGSHPGTRHAYLARKGSRAACPRARPLIAPQAWIRIGFCSCSSRPTSTVARAHTRVPRMWEHSLHPPTQVSVFAIFISCGRSRDAVDVMASRVYRFSMGMGWRMWPGDLCTQRKQILHAPSDGCHTAAVRRNFWSGIVDACRVRVFRLVWRFASIWFGPVRFVGTRARWRPPPPRPKAGR